MTEAKLDEVIKIYTDNAEYVRQRGDLEGCMEFRELAEFLAECKKILTSRWRWIPVTAMLPEELEPVNITWVNHYPELYYAYIKDKPFTATGVYYRGQWYWWSTRCEDMLREYGRYELDKVDNCVEIVAWMPLPEPYRVESEDKG